MLAPFFLSLAGCGHGNYINENDKLRARVLELESQITDYKNRTEAAEKRLEIEKQSHAVGRPALPEGVSIPAVSRIEIVKPSRGVDTNGDGKDDAIRVYLETYDQKNRFLQSLAAAEVTVAAVPAGEDAITVAKRRFDAKAFDDSYRSATGTHYTLLVPLQTPVPGDVRELTVTVRLKDLLTGATHEARKIVGFSASR